MGGRTLTELKKNADDFLDDIFLEPDDALLMDNVRDLFDSALKRAEPQNEVSDRQIEGSTVACQTYHFIHDSTTVEVVALIRKILPLPSAKIDKMQKDCEICLRSASKHSSITAKQEIEITVVRLMMRGIETTLDSMEARKRLNFLSTIEETEEESEATFVTPPSAIQQQPLPSTNKSKAHRFFEKWFGK